MQIQYLNRTNLMGKRHLAVFGEKMVFVELKFALDQSGGVVAETYTTGGMAISDAVLAYVGLKRLHQVVQLTLGTYVEAIGAGANLVNCEWDASTGKLLLYRTSTALTEVANGVDLASTTLRLMLLGA